MEKPTSIKGELMRVMMDTNADQRERHWLSLGYPQKSYNTTLLADIVLSYLSELAVLNKLVTTELSNHKSYYTFNNILLYNGKFYITGYLFNTSLPVHYQIMIMEYNPEVAEKHAMMLRKISSDNKFSFPEKKVISEPNIIRTFKHSKECFYYTTGHPAVIVNDSLHVMYRTTVDDIYNNSYMLHMNLNNLPETGEIKFHGEEKKKTMRKYKINENEEEIVKILFRNDKFYVWISSSNYQRIVVYSGNTRFGQFKHSKELDGNAIFLHTDVSDESIPDIKMVDFEVDEKYVYIISRVRCKSIYINVYSHNKKLVAYEQLYSKNEYTNVSCYLQDNFLFCLKKGIIGGELWVYDTSLLMIHKRSVEIKAPGYISTFIVLKNKLYYIVENVMYMDGLSGLYK